MPADAAKHRRRIDRVLDPSFLTGLAEMEMDDLRSRRAEAEQEEVDLSYLRRLLQGRIDLIAAELARRTSTGDAQPSIVHELTDVFADRSRPSSTTRNRFVTVQPTQHDQQRRRLDQLIEDIDLSDPGTRSDDELTRALAVYRDAEKEISAQRKAVQQVMDDASAEVGRRYRDGITTADETLAEGD